MRKINIVTFLAIVALGTTMLQAQASRTWVSGVGDDANPCSRTAPCKTFAGAISKTAPGGEIDALDPGGFGALTITKSITIDGGGGQVASVLVAGTNGIVVAAAAGDIVILRNLRFQGLRGGGNANAGLSGIRWISGLELNIENCYIVGFNNNGIDIALNQNTAGSAHIINTIIKNVGGSGVKAVNAQAPVVQVSISGSAAILDTIGFEASTHSRMIVRESIAQNASDSGVKADDADAQVTVYGSDLSYNGSGVQATAGASANVAFNNLAYNVSCALNNNGGNSVASFGNNRRVGGPNCGTITFGIAQE